MPAKTPSDPSPAFADKLVLWPFRAFYLQDADADLQDPVEMDLLRAGILQHAFSSLFRLLDHIAVTPGEMRLSLFNLPESRNVHVTPLTGLDERRYRGRAFVRDTAFELEITRWCSPAQTSDDSRSPGHLLTGVLELGRHRQEFLLRCR